MFNGNIQGYCVIQRSFEFNLRPYLTVVVFLSPTLGFALLSCVYKHTNSTWLPDPEQLFVDHTESCSVG